MTQLSINIPQTKEEFESLNENEKNQLVKALNEVRNQSQEFVRMMVEEAVAPILLAYPDIRELTIDPHYEYNDEGYCHNNVMPFINGDYYGSDHLEAAFEEIDNACSELSDIMSGSLDIDVESVRQRFKKPEAPKGKKTFSNRYRV